jgi:hypothetical protein
MERVFHLSNIVNILPFFAKDVHIAKDFMKSMTKATRELDVEFQDRLYANCTKPDFSEMVYSKICDEKK